MEFSKAKILRLSLDIFLFGTVVAGFVLSLEGLIPATHTRVSCDDSSIRMPFNPNTVSVKMLLLVTLALPVVVIAILELAIPPANCSRASPLRQGLERIVHILKTFFIGGVFTAFTTDVIKTITGEPRPFFWSVCAPNITAEQCKQITVSVSWRDCTNPLNFAHEDMVDSMKSFPSGHASISVFSSIFMIVYIKQRLWNKCSLLVAPWLQLLWVMWTVFCCQSRIWDNWHHWWDVVTGIILGTITAFLTLKYLSNWFFREGDAKCGSLEDPEYDRQEERTSSFSHTSIKRLISTTSESDNHVDHRPENSELSNINGTP